METLVNNIHLKLTSQLTENGLVEAVAVLISKMPRMRPHLAAGKLGESYESKPDFIKAWEKWRGQITKLDCSAFWLQCGHQKTREGLKNLLHIIMVKYRISFSIRPKVLR